ncbi:MAG: hypothetical protein KGS61_09255 [Verrucomicrobia bacterium]|nr:hypothetical protein [Verrucomicrobiota bacterium]
MKRRRKLELLLDDIRSLLADRTQASRDSALVLAVWDLGCFLDELAYDATIQELLALAQQTNSRSTAVGALNALVETGVISEFEALDRLDDWKGKH